MTAPTTAPTTDRLPTTKARKQLLALIFAGPIAGAVVCAVNITQSRARGTFFALLVLIVFLAVVLWVAERTGRSPSNHGGRFGFLQLLLGADGRYSTSKTVVAVWTLVFVSALILLTALSWFDSGLSTASTFGSNWDSYLLLLGGPFASAVLAKGIMVGKINDSPAAKTSTSAASGTALPTTTSVASGPAVTDIVSNDAGETDLVDTQYVLFTFVAIVYFVGSLVVNIVTYVHSGGMTCSGTSAIGLPVIPNALLGLTSLGAATYVGNKATQQKATGATLSPNPVVAGGAVTVIVPTLPEAAAVATVSVLCADGTDTVAAAVVAVDTARSTVTFTAPGAGTYEVTLVAPGTSIGPLALTVT